jgi:hypothetical protein
MALKQLVLFGVLLAGSLSRWHNHGVRTVQFITWSFAHPSQSSYIPGMAMRPLILLSLACVALVAVVLHRILSQPPEPSYQGRPLSYWTAMYVEPFGPPANREQARQAIHEIGTNALPYLHATLCGDPESPRAGDAELTLTILGPEAKALVPELTRLIAESDNRSTRSSARLVLQHIGADALPPVLSLLTNQQGRHRSEIVECTFIPAATNQHLAVTVLMQCLNDKDESLARASAKMLRMVTVTNADLVFPALSNSLHDPRPAVRSQAAATLGRMLAQDTYETLRTRRALLPIVVHGLTNSLGDRDDEARFEAAAALEALTLELPQATRTAVPALLTARGDPDLRVRRAVTNALRNLSAPAQTNLPPVRVFSLLCPAPLR